MYNPPESPRCVVLLVDLNHLNDRLLTSCLATVFCGFEIGYRRLYTISQLCKNTPRMLKSDIILVSGGNTLLGYHIGMVKLHHIMSVKTCQNHIICHINLWLLVIIYHCNVSEPDLKLLIEMTNIFLGWVWDG